MTCNQIESQISYSMHERVKVSYFPIFFIKYA